MRRGITSVAAALGGCGTGLLPLWHCWLRVLELLLTRCKYAELLSATAWKEEKAEIFISERGGSQEGRAGRDRSVLALGSSQKGWLLSAVTPKAGHVPFGPGSLLLTCTVGTGRLSWGRCRETREDLALLEMK